MSKSSTVLGGVCGCDGPVCGPPNSKNKKRTRKKDLRVVQKKKDDNIHYNS